MSDADFDYEDENAGPEGLRSHAKKLEKELKQLRAEYAETQKSLRARSVSDVLKEKGADPALAKFYAGDDASPEAVQSWLEENGTLFGWSNGEKSEEQTNTEKQAERISQTTAEAPVGDGPTLETMLATYPAEKLIELGIIQPPRQ